MATTLNVLLVEDNIADQKLVVEVLESGDWRPSPYVVSDGVEALDFLRRRGRFRKAPRPDLILLDLNLPRKDGRAVLREIKEDPSLKVIPVVVFTTSTSDDDLRFCYSNATNAYVIKPLGIDEYFAAVEEVKNFWLRRVQPCPAATVQA